MTQDIKLDVHEAMVAPTEHPQWEFEDEDEDGESKGIICLHLMMFVYKVDFTDFYFYLKISGEESDDEFATDDDYDDDDD